MRSFELQKRYLEKIKSKIDDPLFETEITVQLELNIPILKISEILHNKTTAYIFFSPDYETSALSLMIEYDGVFACNELRFLDAFYPKRRSFTLFDFNTVLVKGIIMPFMLWSIEFTMSFFEGYKEMDYKEIGLVQQHRNNYLLRSVQNGFTTGLEIFDNKTFFLESNAGVKYKRFERTLDIFEQARIVRTKKIFM